MHDEFAAGWADPARIPDTVRDGVRQFRETHGHHDHPAETVRTATYHGHQIVVRTRYSVEVDGRPVDGHLAVTDDGSVHYHPLPNYSFGSALDLVKQVIDSFPDDFDGDFDGGVSGGAHTSTPPSASHHEHGG